MQIQSHNAFLDSIFKHATSSDCSYKMYLPDVLPELHPTEVTDQFCIIPCNETNEEQFMKLINNYYIYNGFQSTGMLDLVQLEKDIVKLYIAGKPLIANNSNMRRVFRFRNSPTEALLLGNK